jgi:hypothetical protein
MDNAKLQVTERIKQATNVLVTVSTNPSVDQLAACIALTLILNKLNKHGTAVFSGTVPSTIEFLQPEKTIEKNTDSLRDFIIALDKSKADKLRYKVEDKVVKIFITPYRTTINEKDLEFSQGDFNVDVVICLGVHQQNDLDQTITSHGRILHDATVISITNSSNVELGSIHWEDTSASSLSEMIVQLADDLDKNILDGQIATALLTGIVAETNRFSNERTTPQTMSISARLMTAGANQQLVATKLEPPPPWVPPNGSSPPTPIPETPSDDQDSGATGVLTVNHSQDTPSTAPPTLNPPPPPTSEAPPAAGQIHIDDDGNPHGFNDQPLAPPPTSPFPDASDASSTSVSFPSSDQFQSPSQPVKPPEPVAPVAVSTDSMTLPPVNIPSSGGYTDDQNPSPATPPNTTFDQSTKTLTQLEEAVHSPHIEPPPSEVPTIQLPITGDQNPSTASTSDIESARNAVEAAMDSAQDQPLPPIAALNAQPLGAELHPIGSEPAPSQQIIKSPSTALPVTDNNPLSDDNVDQPSGAPQYLTGPPPQPPEALTMPQPGASYDPLQPPTDTSNANPISDPLNNIAPPPVPPPMTFIQPTQVPAANSDQGLGGGVSDIAL